MSLTSTKATTTHADGFGEERNNVIRGACDSAPEQGETR
jgi:hypothetical protein